MMHTATFGKQCKEHWAWLLIFSFLLLLPFKLYEVPMGIMALIGLARLARAPRAAWQDPALRLMWLLFFCIWVPMLLSLTDAVNVNRALSTTLGFLRFPLAGIFIIQTLRAPQTWERLWLGVILLIGFWCVDGLIQLIAGVNLLGHPYDGTRLSGIFYPKLTLGIVLATLSPLYFAGLRRYLGQYRYAWLLAVPLLIVVFFAAQRAAWVVLALATMVYVAYLLYTSTRARGNAPTAAVLILLIAGATGLWSLEQPGFSSRVSITLKSLSGDYEDVNQASSLRLPIWRTALNMAQAHWINGVGPRGFRYVYRGYASADDPFLASGGPPTHPHQMLIEIATETGVFGVLGYLLFIALFTRRMLRLAAEQRHLLFPMWLAVLLAMFPINTHMAFYASYWSSITWWLILLALAGYARATENSRSAHQPG